MPTQMLTEQSIKILREGESPVVPGQRITREQVKEIPENCLVIPMVIFSTPEKIKKRKSNQ